MVVGNRGHSFSRASAARQAYSCRQWSRRKGRIPLSAAEDVIMVAMPGAGREAAGRRPNNFPTER
ncbi:hypothetical protein C1703_01170 [Streptomyces sp. Go-475]|nr:hypothetical protein C1703_01170 [Streptomyces sp. Go-475]